MISLSGLLKHDPIAPLLNSGNNAIIYFTKRDFLNKDVPSIQSIWNLPEPMKILSKQSESGCWKSRNRKRDEAPAVNYDLFETFKAYSQLVECYEFNQQNENIKKASEYFFSCQTSEGDFRGIIGEQYAPYYTGLITALLIRAGYQKDPRIDRAINWLLSMRQDDGGWVIGSPGCFGKYSKEEHRRLTTHFVGTRRDFDYSKPFTHAGTGMVLRAFAVHPRYRNSEEAKKAAILLRGNFFKRDKSSSYQHPDNWVNFKYPFFWTDLISALDSLSLIGISEKDPHVEKALKWLIDNQLETGLWKNSYSSIHSSIQNEKTYEVQLWISLAICRIFKRFSTMEG